MPTLRITDKGTDSLFISDSSCAEVEICEEGLTLWLFSPTHSVAIELSPQESADLRTAMKEALLKLSSKVF